MCWAPQARRIRSARATSISCPTIEGGTHVTGPARRGGTGGARVLRVPQSCAARHKPTPEDVWDKANYVLSVKIQDPASRGKMKERLGSRDAAPLVESFARDSLALWLNRHPEARRAHRAVRDRERPGARPGGAEAVRRIAGGPAPPGKLADCASQEPKFLVEVDRPAVQPSRRATRTSRPSCCCVARS